MQKKQWWACVRASWAYTGLQQNMVCPHLLLTLPSTDWASCFHRFIAKACECHVTLRASSPGGLTPGVGGRVVALTLAWWAGKAPKSTGGSKCR